MHGHAVARCAKTLLRWTLALLPVASLVPAGPAAAGEALCYGAEATITGTSGADRLVGTDGDDVIVAGEGRDVVRGLGGGDRICAGPGHDVVFGGRNDGALEVIGGGPGDDSLHGEAGGDELRSGPGDDVLNGGTGTDGIRPGPGRDVARGGPGYNIAEYFDAPSGLRANLRDGFVRTGGERDRVSGITQFHGSMFDDVIIGTRRGDYLFSHDGDDRIFGGTGGDYLEGGEGDDGIEGGRGADFAGFSSSRSGVEVDLRTRSATGQGADSLAGIENVWGSFRADVLRGDDRANELFGADGLDTIEGRAGADRLWVFSEASSLDGGGGIDTAEFILGPVVIDLTLGTGTTASGSPALVEGIENLVGSDEPDTLVGDEAPNRILGGGGGDSLDGRGGRDVLDGGPGRDTCANGEVVTECEGQGRRAPRLTPPSKTPNLPGPSRRSP